MSESAAWRIVSRAILFTFVVLLSLWLLSQLTSVVVRLILAVILAAGMRPLVDRATAVDLQHRERWTPPRGLIVLLVYVTVILLVVVVGGLIVQVVFKEVTNLINAFPTYAPQIITRIDELIDWIPGGRQFLQDFDITAQLSGLVSRVLNVFAQAVVVLQYLLGLVGGLLDVLMILLMALYITTDGTRIGRYLRTFLPSDRHEQASRITNRIFVRLGGWVSGQILLCVIIGGVSWVGLTLIGVPYAAALALIAGIMEAVPNIGPIIAAVPAVIVALLYSPWQALMVAILYLVIQQLENYVIVPRVMSKAVELHPLVVLLALLVGGELMGVLGAVLAVPVTAAISVIVDEIRSERLAPSVDPEVALAEGTSDKLLPKRGIPLDGPADAVERREIAEGRAAVEDDPPPPVAPQPATPRPVAPRPPTVPPETGT